MAPVHRRPPGHRRLVILDRDGTLIDFVRDTELGSVVSAFHPDQIRLLPTVTDGLRELEHAGYLLAMATNQPGAAKGEVPVAAIARTNEALVRMLGDHGLTIASVAVCHHHPVGGPGGDPALVGPCDCRKPAPGLLRRVLGELRVAPEVAWMLGDSAADMGAAHAAGVRSALIVPARRCELCPMASDGGALGGQPTIVAGSMAAAVRKILAADEGG